MKAVYAIAMLASLMAAPVLVGCDHEVAHSDTTVRHADGTVTHKDTTVTEKANGDVVRESTRTNTP